MRRVLALTIALLAVPASTASAVDPLEGRWIIDGGRIVEITPGTTTPLQGHTVENGSNTCGDRDVDLRLTPAEPRRYTGPGALYAVRGGACAERIEDAFVEIVLGRNDNVAAVTYTPPPSAPPCSDCTQVWTRIAGPPRRVTEPVCAGRRLSGTSGNDTLVGGPASDQIFGGRGRDTISGFGRGDCIYGGTGNDRLRGGAGNDKLVGGRDDDLLVGYIGNDWLDSGTGLDTVRAGAGADTVIMRSIGTVDAGIGNDVIDARNRDFNTVVCGSGTDTVEADRRDDLSGCEFRSVE